MVQMTNATEPGYILRCEIVENAKISIPNEIPYFAKGVRLNFRFGSKCIL